MSEDREPPDHLVIDLRPAAQLTRATVRKNEIAFEIQATEPESATAFAHTLQVELRHQFGKTERGDYTSDRCPVNVTVDDNDKRTIVAT
jgi:hypothetical protein